MAMMLKMAMLRRGKLPCQQPQGDQKHEGRQPQEEGFNAVEYLGDGGSNQLEEPAKIGHHPFDCLADPGAEGNDFGGLV
jgi:hypothetical protein